MAPAALRSGLDLLEHFTGLCPRLREVVPAEPGFNAFVEQPAQPLAFLGGGLTLPLFEEPINRRGAYLGNAFHRAHGRRSRLLLTLGIYAAEPERATHATLPVAALGRAG